MHTHIKEVVSRNGPEAARVLPEYCTDDGGPSGLIL
jgi:hypothetical protein